MFLKVSGWFFPFCFRLRRLYLGVLNMPFGSFLMRCLSHVPIYNCLSCARKAFARWQQPTKTPARLLVSPFLRFVPLWDHLERFRAQGGRAEGLVGIRCSDLGEPGRKGRSVVLKWLGEVVQFCCQGSVTRVSSYMSSLLKKTTMRSMG